MIDAELAIDSLERQLAATPRAARPREHAVLAYRLGLALAESPTGQPEANLRAALERYEVAAALFDPRFEPAEHARVLNAAGAANRALAAPALAEEQFERAATLLEPSGRNQERAAVLNNLGLVRSERGRLDGALDAFGSAAGLFDAATPEGRRGRAAALLNQGLARSAVATPASLRGALADFEAAESMVGEGEAPYHVALVAHSSGVAGTALAAVDPSSSERLVRDAVTAFERSLAFFTRAGFPYQHALAKQNLGRALTASGSTADLRRALACFEDATSLLDPRLHAEVWRRAHAGLVQAEGALAARGHRGTRSEHFVALLDSVTPEERIDRLRERLTRFLALPERARHPALVELAGASVTASDHGLGLMSAELTILTELPTEHLEAALLARLAAHRGLRGGVREQADRALDQAVGDALNGPQRVFVRDHLAEHGFERP